MTDIYVSQGNGNGRSILAGSSDVLYTHHMVGCIAILIKTPTQCHLIHSDTSGGAVPLIEGFKLLGLKLTEEYEIGLMGGQSMESLVAKQKELEKIFPKSKIETLQAGVDGACINGNGVRAATRARLKVRSTESKLVEDGENINPSVNSEDLTVNENHVLELQQKADILWTRIMRSHVSFSKLEEYMDLICDSSSSQDEKNQAVESLIPQLEAARQSQENNKPLFNTKDGQILNNLNNLIETIKELKHEYPIKKKQKK